MKTQKSGRFTYLFSVVDRQPIQDEAKGHTQQGHYLGSARAGLQWLHGLQNLPKIQQTAARPQGPEPMGGVFDKYSVQAVAWLFSKKSGLFFGISRFKKIDTVS